MVNASVFRITKSPSAFKISAKNIFSSTFKFATIQFEVATLTTAKIPTTKFIHVMLKQKENVGTLTGCHGE
jgi:hypothetical protein